LFGLKNAHAHEYFFPKTAAFIYFRKPADDWTSPGKLFYETYCYCVIWDILFLRYLRHTVLALCFPFLGSRWRQTLYGCKSKHWHWHIFNTYL